jgi:pyruvate,water dikinase
MNYGNILSHGAVVAREYRIPVVIFNDAATSVFENGQWIEINGDTGRIRIISTDTMPADEHREYAKVYTKY